MTREVHHVSRLIDLCAEVDASFEQLRDCERLSAFAVSLRYPGPPPAAQRPVGELLASAERAVAFVVHRLPDEMHP